MNQGSTPAAQPPDNPEEAPKREQSRRFQVSTNHGAARHRVRYTETGGALVDTQECTFCQVTPDLSGAGSGCEVVKARPTDADVHQKD